MQLVRLGLDFWFYHPPDKAHNVLVLITLPCKKAENKMCTAELLKDER